MKLMTQKRRISIWSLLILSIIAISCNDGTTSGNDSEPEIFSISPASGPIGASVTISGSNFSTVNSDNEVFFNGTNAVVTSSSAQAIQTSVPSGATTGAVSLTVDGKQVTGPVFTIVSDSPSINSVEPDSGKVGDEIIVEGINFGSASNTSIEFGTISATIKSITATEAVVDVPEGVTPGLVDIKLTVDNKSTIYTDFNVLVEEARIIPASTSGGGRHTCALDISGDAYCWGRNAEGQLGTGVTSSNKESPQPVRMLFGTSFQQISVGANHTVALDKNGSVWVWGANFDGQLGDGTTQYSQFMKQVSFPETVSFVKISAGRRHTVVLDENGNAWAWGSNSNGRLGDSTEVDRLTPIKVRMPDGITFSDVTAGSGRTMALTESGDYWGWGFNGNGRLGNGDTEDKLVPVKGILPAGVVFRQLTAGWLHNLAIDNNGKLWTWGFNGEGQLGDGSTISRSEPTSVSISSSLTFESISAGRNFNLVKADDGSFWAWGDNNYGQIGIGSSDNDQLLPVMLQVPSNEIFVSIGIGESHSLAISEKDELWSWGFNSTGQLGDSTQVNRSLPVKVKF